MKDNYGIYGDSNDDDNYGSNGRDGDRAEVRTLNAMPPPR